MSLADQASLLLIPSGYKSQKLYSIFPTNGVGDFDFSRSGSATRIAQNGLITTVDSNVPRLNYSMIDGKVVGCPSLILEPVRTNLETKSNEFSTWGTVSNTTRTADYIISPDGTLNGTRLQFTANGYVANTSQSLATYTVSCYAKRNDNGTQNVGFFTNGSGVVNSAWEITSEWKRFTYTYTSSNTSFVGIASNSGADISVYGFQIEQGSYPTSYIPTNGSAVTRSAETANGSGDAATFSDSEGVLMAEISALADDNTDRKIGIVQGSTQNQVSIGYSISTKKIRAISYDGAVKGETFTNVVDVLNSNKIAYKYKDGDNQLWVNGFLLDTNTNTNILDGVTLDNLGFDANASNFYGKTKQLQYYNSALTDSELEQLTSWTSFSDMAQAQQYSTK